MQVHWTYDGCDEHDEGRIERHWEHVQIELEGKVAELADSPSELRIAVARDDAAPEWQIQAALHVLGTTLAVEGAGGTPEEALDSVLHGLAGEMDGFQEIPPATAQRREGLDGILPLLETSRAQNRSEAFFSFLVPLLQTLGPYVQRELQIRESDETLDGEEISVSDVLDEVLIVTWNRFARRNKELSFDLWLVQLADEVINALSSPVAQRSLDDETEAPSTEIREAVRDEWIEQVSYPETIEFSELLPGESGVEAWDELDAETKQAHLAEMLGKLPRERRQAFVLNVAHGFNAAEIADFQDRSIQEVESDVALAVGFVRRYFIEEESPDLEEPFARAEIRERKRRQR